MPATLRSYVVVETLISVFMNTLLSAGATWLAFHGHANITLWGPSGLALDFIPQSFMVGLMSALMPTLLTRKRRRQGRVLQIPGAPPALPRHVLARAVLFALSTVLIAGGAAVLVLSLLGPPAYGFATVLALKSLYGAGVAVVVTLLALHAVLRERHDAAPATGP